MDIFAHTLWTNLVFYKKLRKEKIQRLMALVFGILPDLVSFTPIFIYQIFAKVDFRSLINSNLSVVSYASQSYQYTHSLVIFGLALGLVCLFRKFLNYQSLVYWPMFGWLLHILIDIPSHRGFYETPFLFPISNYKFEHGISWGHPIFMLINYGTLAVVYLVWFLILRRNKLLNESRNNN